MSDPLRSDDELSALLRALRREIEPPPGVLKAILSSRQRERIRKSSWLWQSAVAASLVMLAFAAGRWSAPGPPIASGQDREYAFLLYGGAPDDGTDTTAAEYGRWAHAVAARGTPVRGERLADRAIVVGQSRSSDAKLRGFFIVRAQSEESAVAMATGHPHSAGATIEVRQVDTPR